MPTLTSRQCELLTVIQQFIPTEGYPPTIRELGRALRIRSLRGVLRLQPENPAVKPLRFREADLAGRDVRILGLVVGLVRKF